MRLFLPCLLGYLSPWQRYPHSDGDDVRKKRQHFQENLVWETNRNIKKKNAEDLRPLLEDSFCLEMPRGQKNSLDVKVCGLGLNLERKVLFTSLSVCTNCRLNKPNLFSSAEWSLWLSTQGWRKYTKLSLFSLQSLCCICTVLYWKLCTVLNYYYYY